MASSTALLALRAAEPLAAASLRGIVLRAAAPLAAALTRGSGNWGAAGHGFHSAAAAWAEDKAAAGEQAAAAGDAQQQEQPADEQQAEAQVELTLEEATQALAECREALEGEKKKAEELRDKVLRTLADMENLRERTARTTAETKQFAVQGLVKNLLEVADNLERAAGSVPPADVADGADIDRDRALKLLRSLRDGVLMTDTVLMKVLASEGVSRYDPAGEEFDPNRHNALFEVPDATKPPRTVAVVVKRGYLLNERVVRAAEVGVTRAVDE